MALLVVQDVVVAYAEQRVLNGVSLEVESGQLVALLGPSGSGKTTLLNAVAGFIEVDGGQIALDGKLVSHPRGTVPPEHRRVGVVFQSFALWPHMTVLDTVAYPLRQRGVESAVARQRAHALLDRVGLLEFATRHPGQLSGGQQQRVGLARALAVEPDLFLFDEPTANLDPSLRASLQMELRETQRASGAGGLYVTHDPAEALAISDRVAILRHGQLVQQGSPEEVYTSPVDEWVAALTGPASVVHGEIIDEHTICLSLSGSRRFSCRIHTAAALRSGAARMCIRPEWVSIERRESETASAAVRSLRFQGPHTDYELSTPTGRLLARVPGPPRYAIGTPVEWDLTCAAVLSGPVV